MDPGLWCRCCGKASVGEEVSKITLLHMGCLSSLTSYKPGFIQLLTHSGLSNVASGHMSEDRPHHHVTTAQDAL